MMIAQHTGLDVFREYRFHPVRRWRFDYAMPEVKVAVEIDGGVFVCGRHSRGIGQVRDMEKMNAAAELGWRVLHFTPQQQFTRYCIATIVRTACGKM